MIATSGATMRSVAAVTNATGKAGGTEASACAIAVEAAQMGQRTSACPSC
jgi:hypothetical protein